MTNNKDWNAESNRVTKTSQCSIRDLEANTKYTIKVAAKNVLYQGKTQWGSYKVTSAKTNTSLEKLRVPDHTSNSLGVAWTYYCSLGEEQRFGVWWKESRQA